MHRFRFAGLAAVAVFGFASLASAADLPRKAPVYSPPPPPAFGWTGFYVGGNIGYSWGHADANYTEPAFAGVGGSVTPTLLGSSSLDGIIGGGQIGYNWQTNNWVLGIEADFQGTGEKGSFSNPYPYAGGIFILNHIQDNKLSWLGTVRGRVGVLVTPTLLIYGTGGLAYGKINVSGTINDTGANATGPWFYGSSTTKTGWTAGAGIEGAIPTTRDWTWKLEYLYVDLGTVSGNGVDCCDSVGPFTWSTKVTDNILRVGVNYRFH